jgi:hypothetical protein
MLKPKAKKEKDSNLSTITNEKESIISSMNAKESLKDSLK